MLFLELVLFCLRNKRIEFSRPTKLGENDRLMERNLACINFMLLGYNNFSSALNVRNPSMQFSIGALHFIS